MTWRRIQAIGLMFLALMALSVCARQTPETPTPTATRTPAPTVTLGVVSPVVTATSVPTLCPTNTPTRQQPAATSTPTPVPAYPTTTPELEPVDGPIPTPTPLPFRFATSTPLPSPAYQAAYTSVSPDRQWVAQGVALPPGKEAAYRAQLTVWRTDGSAEWTVVDQTSNWGLGWTTPRPFHWSRDGRSLYFTDYGVPDGCPGFGNGWGLSKVDLADGSVAGVIASVGNWMALSPQEEQLAYVPRSAHAVAIRDLTTGQESTFALETGKDDPTASIGHILWSLDGSALLLAVALDRCQALDKMRHSIVHLDLSTGTETVLIDRDGRLLVTQSWPDPGEVILLDAQERHWRMDTNTGGVARAEDLDLALPASCRADDGETSPYVNPADGYCLRYPDSFRVGDIYQRIANLYGPPLDQSLDPVRAGVATLVEGLVGKPTLAEVADEWLARRSLPPPETHYVSALGDELAEVVVYQGERSRGRAVFVLHQDTLYVLSFYPVDERFPKAAPDVEAAWETVTGSFAFLSPMFGETYGDLCPANDPDTSPYYNLDDGYCLLYPTRFGVGDVRPGMVHLYGSKLDRGTEPVMAALSIAVEGPAGERTLEQVVDEVAGHALPHPGLPITRTAIALGGEPAVVVEGLPWRTMSRQAFAIHDGLVYHVVVQPVDKAFPQAAPDVEAVWQDVLKSFTFIPVVRDELKPEGKSIPGSVILYAQGGGIRSLPHRAVFDRLEMETVYDGVMGEGATNYLGLSAVDASLDGRWLAVHDPLPSGPDVRLPGTTWLVDLAAGTLRSLGSPSAAVTWSPDGRALTYARQDTVYVLDLGGNEDPVAIWQQPGKRLFAARWSPDGAWIAVVGTDARWHEESTLDHWIVSPGGESAVELGAIPLRRTEWTACEVEWAPDGSVFSTFGSVLLTLDGERWDDPTALPDPLPPRLAEKLALRDIQGEPTWVRATSNDGQRIAYGNVYVYDRVSETHARAGEIGDGQVTEIRWSADNSALIVGATRWQRMGFWGTIYALTPEPGSAPELLVEGESVYLLDVVPVAR